MTAADICVMEHKRDPDRPRQALPGLYVCHGHHAELERLIAEMPARADDLDRARGPGGPRPPGAASGLPIDDRAAEHRTQMAGVVASWCRVVAEDRGITTPAGPELHRTCPWLLRHVDWCCGNRWVDEMLSELRQVTGRALALADIPARRVPLAAQCLTHEGGERCTGTVTIIVRGDDWTARCTDCEQVQDATPYLREGWVVAEGVIMVATMRGAPCSAEVVRQWHHRRKITGERRGERMYYDLKTVNEYLDRRGAQNGRLAS